MSWVISLSKQLLRVSILTEFLVHKTGSRWDVVPVDSVAISDLDRESFEIFRKEAVRTERMMLWTDLGY